MGIRRFADSNGTAADDLIHLAGDGLSGLNDVPLATPGNDRLYGLGGNDVLCGGTGVDHSSGGAGNDRLVLLGGQDLAVGGTYHGGNGYDELIGPDLTDAVSFDGVGLAGIAALLAFAAGVGLRASQLTQFSLVQTGTIQILTTGTIAMTDGEVRTHDFQLCGLGNHIILSGDPVPASHHGGFHGRVVGGIGADWIQVLSDISGSTGEGPRVILRGESGLPSICTRLKAIHPSCIVARSSGTVLG